MFRQGFGYLAIERFEGGNGRPVDIDSLDKHNKDVVLKFDIGVGSNSLSAYKHYSSHPCEFCFPSYYAKIDGRLILIRENNIKWISRYSQKSREIMALEVKNTLLKALEPNFDFLNPITSTFYKISEEKRKTMTEDQIVGEAWCVYGLTMSSFRTVLVHFDGSVSYKYVN